MRIKFIDSIKFMSSSTSSLTHNLSERLHKEKCKNYKSNLEYATTKEDILTFKRVCCNQIMKKLPKKFQPIDFKTPTNSVMETSKQILSDAVERFLSKRVTR